MAAIVPRFLQQRTDNGFAGSHADKSPDLDAKPGKPIAGPLWGDNRNGPDSARLLAGVKRRVRRSV